MLPRTDKEKRIIRRIRTIKKQQIKEQFIEKRLVTKFEKKKSLEKRTVGL